MNTLQSLMHRRLPREFCRNIRLQLQVEDGDAFTVAPGADGALEIRGGNELAAAAGLHYYLKYECGAHFSWCGDTMVDDAPAPVPARTVSRRLPLPLRGYFNFCTFGYSAAWWDWERWEKEIDFMALNAINLPLAVTGIEAVWRNTFARLGVSDAGLAEFFSGPAFLPWQWMDNIDGHAGPLPASWIDGHVELGRRILEREQAWGMKPILPVFSGHVPREFARMHPDALYLKESHWCGFEPVKMLSPADPLFREVMTTYLEELGALFGRTGYYAIDLFHERALPTSDPEELAGIAANVAATLLAVDPDAVWVMQAWSENEHVIRAIPDGHLLILDLGKERLAATGGLYGVPTVWGTIHSFGGQTEIGGDLAAIPEALEAARQFPNLVGAGAFPESITNNPVLFELVFESAVTERPISVPAFVEQYVNRRYGTVSAEAQDAWRELLASVYTARRGDPLMAARPMLEPDRANAWAGFRDEDTPDRFFPAWRKLLAAAPKCGGSDGYRFDLIDLGRQALSSLGRGFLAQCRDAFRSGDADRFEGAAAEFLGWLDDCDLLLASRREFRLDAMIEEARRWGATREEADLYEKNVRLQLTLWGPEHEPQPLFDYCVREWQGLIAGYYRVRWQRFFAYLAGFLARGEAYDESAFERSDNRPALCANAFYTDLFGFEQSWVASTESVKPESTPDELRVAGLLFQKYQGHAKRFGSTRGAGESASRRGADLLTGFHGDVTTLTGVREQ